MQDAPLRVLASGILFRAVLRAFPRAPSVEEKMRIHQLVEERAWSLAPEQLALADGRDVDDGPPVEWDGLVRALVGEALNTRAP